MVEILAHLIHLSLRLHVKDFLSSFLANAGAGPKSQQANQSDSRNPEDDSPFQRHRQHQTIQPKAQTETRSAILKSKMVSLKEIIRPLERLS